MKIYVSGPPVDSIEFGDELHMSLYRLIKDVTDGKHVVIFPIRTPELIKLKPKEFYKEMARRIDDVEAVISVSVVGDQSTMIEATIASEKKKPQSVIQIGAAPRLLRGLPNIVEVVRISFEDSRKQVESVVENLTTSVRALRAS